MKIVNPLDKSFSDLTPNARGDDDNYWRNILSPNSFVEQVSVFASTCLGIWTELRIAIAKWKTISAIS